MKSRPKIGAEGEERFVVAREHAIDFSDNEMPSVLSTPWLVWFLEHAARQAVLSCLEPNESTVGVEIEVRHLAPTPPGQTVVCRARVVRVDGPEVWFHVDARDEIENIANGFHKLRVIRKDRFASRVRKKNRAGASPEAS